MRITKRCELTGETNTLDINVTEEQINNWMQGELIQNAMPQLSADDREFLMTGMMPDDWDKLMQPED